MKTNSPLRIGVVGVGAMGSNHARVYNSLKGVEVVAIVDSDLDRASEISQIYGGKPYRHWDEIVDEIDAVSITTPTSSHSEATISMLEAGIHCLVEKPLAPTVSDCKSILSAAKKCSSLLMVGHIERFNPAVGALSEILNSADDHIFSIEANRKSTLSSRVEDVDVITDLMVHDIDVILNLINEKVVDIVARSPIGPNGDRGDFATAILTFDSGKSAHLTASRVTQSHIRELQVTTDKRLFLLDYSSQELLISHQGQLESIGELGISKYLLDLMVETVMIQKQEPLTLELSAFVAAVKNNDPSPVSGDSALRAMQIVSEIQSQIDSQI